MHNINLILFLLVITGMAGVFKKAGRHWWEAIIPIYNVYVLIKITRTSGWWFLAAMFLFIGVTLWGIGSFIGSAYPAFYSVTHVLNYSLPITIFAGIIGMIVIGFVVPSRLARAFGYGIGMSLGLIILPFIFYPILGFNKSAYQLN